MKRIAAFFIAVVAVAALSAVFTIRWVEARHAAIRDPHEWLHSELKLSPEQHRALELSETKFAERNRKLREQMRAANHELAVAIGKGQPDSPEISAAIGKIHLRMGELQKQTTGVLNIFDGNILVGSIPLTGDPAKPPTQGTITPVVGPFLGPAGTPY